MNDDRIDRNQWSPRIARGANGSILVVWMDGRNGSDGIVDYDIYSMFLQDPGALGSSLNRRLNDDPPGPIQAYPDLAASPSGTFLCVWEDGRSGNRDIYAAALDSMGTPITPSLRVNDDVGSADQFLPRVIPIGSDQYLVAWGDGRELNGEIFISYRTRTGAPVGGNRRVSVDPVAGGSYQGEPSVAVNASGRTLVVWLDGREGGSGFGVAFDIFGQWLDPAGDPIGGNFKINIATGLQHCSSPTVTADPVLGFVVAWVDQRNGGDAGDIYLQRFDASGAPAGGNTRANDDPLGREQKNVRAFAGVGVAAVLWEDLRGNLGIDSNVEGSFVPYDAGPAGPNFRVNTDIGGRQGTPAAVWDGRDAYIGVWEDGRHGSSDVFAISFLPTGERRGADTQLNDDAAPNDQRRPRLGHGPGKYLATWIDRRANSNDLYGQWITAAGARDGVNHLLWHDDAFNWPVAAQGAVARSGDALVAAQITRFTDAGEIRGFVYGSSGAPPIRSFWISDNLPSAQAIPCAVGSDSEFAVLWLDGREGPPRLYGQRLQADGTRIGGNHRVLLEEPLDPVFGFDFESDLTGGYWLCYAEGTSADQRLWLVHLDPDLTANSIPYLVAPQTGGARAAPSVGVSDDGRIEVVWLGEGSDGLARVYHQSYAAGLSPLSATPFATESFRAEAAPCLALSGPNSVVAWEERGPQGDWSIWMQRFQNGAPRAAPARVDQDLTASDQYDPAAGIDGAGHVVVVWTDLRSTSSGTDILGRTFELVTTSAEDPPPVSEPPPSPAPHVTRIGASRPNPFSSVTAAPVEVANPGDRVLASVWNARGERVTVLWDGTSPGGQFTLRWNGRAWDGRSVASGIYWITVETGGKRYATRVVHLR